MKFPGMIPVLAALVLISLPGQGKARADQIRVTDARGHALTLEAPPCRIACLYAFSGHVITMLDRGQDMVAVVKGLKKDRLLARILPEIAQIPSPSTGGIIHAESLLKTHPDIVFLKPETARIREEIKKLERMHLPYFTVGYADMSEQMAMIRSMGRILGKEDKARAYTRYYRKAIERVARRVREIPAARRVRLYHSINEPLRTDAPGTLEADWTEACGVINVSTEALVNQGNKHFAGMEQVLLWNPDIIIVNENKVAGTILSDRKWAPIQAVLDKKVYAIPVGISRWGHPGGLETPLAVLWTAKTVYPERFADLDLEQEVVRFYRQFFNLDLDSGTVARILSGKGMRKARL